MSAAEMPSEGNENGRWRLAADVGGTFTDVILSSPVGAITTTKILSTPEAFGRAVLDGIAHLTQGADSSPNEIGAVVHATTIATNSILERKGPRAGLITTRGFRDVLELRRIRFPETYNLRWHKPPALVPRRLRSEITERIGAGGEIVVPLDVAEARATIRELVEDERIESLAICLLNSYVNPEHELLLGELVRETYPALPLSLSCEVLPEIKEYERTSTTTLNAYLKPVVSGYLRQLEQQLKTGGYESPLYLMQESGGVTTARAAEAYPIHIVESGAAAGVIGGCELIRAHGFERAITFDMGGTTAKACLVEDGEPMRASEYEVGASISAGSRLLRGAGDLLRAPAVDVVEVGAGAGSIVHVDAAGGIHVGPQSAGALPGPVCYQRGGTQPTVTDANVVLGYLPQGALLGGSFPISADAARRVVSEVAQQLGGDTLGAAYGIHQIANAAMARAIRAVTTERGRDLRGCVLVAFGGSGPTHAAGIAQTLGIPQIVIPRWPGVFSALGLLSAPIERRLMRTMTGGVDELKVEAVQEAFSELENRAIAELLEEGYPRPAIQVSRTAELHYRGQWYELEVPVAMGQIRSLSPIEEAFEAAYEAQYGYRQERRPVDLVNVRVAASIPASNPQLEPVPSLPSAEPATRLAYFGGDGPVEAAVVAGREYLRTPRSGPLIIDEFDSTIVVPPGAMAGLDSDGNIVLEL